MIYTRHSAFWGVVWGVLVGGCHLMLTIDDSIWVSAGGTTLVTVLVYGASFFCIKNDLQLLQQTDFDNSWYFQDRLVDGLFCGLAAGGAMYFAEPFLPSWVDVVAGWLVGRIVYRNKLKEQIVINIWCPSDDFDDENKTPQKPPSRLMAFIGAILLVNCIVDEDE